MMKISAIEQIFSIANQRGRLLSRSIFENLIWGDKFATKDKAVNILEKSGLKSLVDDKGINFMITDGGDNISGGQRQRMIIARALMKDKSKVIIFDDSFSALDTKTEAEVIRNILDIGKTTIFVSQRVSTVKKCDKIIIMDAGKIVDIGKHEELLNRSTMYREIVESQKINEDSN